MILLIEMDRGVEAIRSSYRHTILAVENGTQGGLKGIFIYLCYFCVHILPLL